MNLKYMNAMRPNNIQRRGIEKWQHKFMTRKQD